MTEDASAILRRRQGAGARYDAETAPREALVLARRGTAHLVRLLDRCDALDAPVAPGRTRRMSIAMLGYEARLVAEALARLRRGDSETPVLSPSATLLAHGATLPDHALRHLFRHAAAHLDVEWRDLPDSAWAGQLATTDGPRLAVRDTPRHRAHRLWQASLDFGGRWRDVPAALRPPLTAGGEPGKAQDVREP